MLPELQSLVEDALFAWHVEGSDAINSITALTNVDRETVLVKMQAFNILSTESINEMTEINYEKLVSECALALINA